MRLIKYSHIGIVLILIVFISLFNPLTSQIDKKIYKLLNFLNAIGFFMQLYVLFQVY